MRCHGDLHTGNLLTTSGRISAVIDFGELALQAPACGSPFTQGAAAVGDPAAGDRAAWQVLGAEPTPTSVRLR
ncbi:phosphotransferase [Streptomyces sp. Da 82-17]|uniref:phosphotransferase n=1 Tax=Streptomyces sp. Da 82-17 TaxID=3377116 RepID=UPI0038D40E63